MPWKPSTEGEVPTLGWYVLDWMSEYLARPALGYYEPFAPYREQEDFVLRWYELDPLTGRFRYDRGLLGRSRGWGKSPILGALCLVEGMADVLFDGWDADGQPVGKPWTTIRTPLVHVAAVSEDQTGNTWQPMIEMISDQLLDDYPGLEPFDTRINLPRGAIEKRTSSGRTVKGAPTTFAVLDQTEEWVPSVGGPALAQKIRTNTAKNGGRTLESPNAYIPGEMSVAEASAQAALAGREGRTRRGDTILWDHREAPADTDLTDRESLIAGLRYAYGDSSGHPDGCVLHDPPCAPGHVDLEAQIAVIWDPATDVQTARSDYLNQITHASDSWLTRPEWNARSITTLEMSGIKVAPLEPGDVITLGFDGSRKRNRGITDATALVACRISDGVLFPLGIWEQPDNADADWRIPTDEIDAKVTEAFATYRVVGFYADPAKWEGYVAQWEAKFGARLKVRATRSNPIEWWMVGATARRVTDALEAFRNAVIDCELIHDGSSTLTRHVLAARVRTRPAGYGIFKEHPDSANKIDGAVAAVLAWTARLDAVSAGLGAKPAPIRAPRRIR